MACESLVPVVHEVLLLNNEEQAFARCIASSLNRGREAARAAISMLDLLAEQQETAKMVARRNSVSRTGSLI
jgi:6,7-dimethyl-8-ribityllumazine synthase